MSELTLALKIIKEYCGEQSSDSCNECPLNPVCYKELKPMCLDIPEPPPEPTDRQRIEWLRCLPDDEMLDAVNHIGPHSLFPWHEVVSLGQFRKDVGLDERNNRVDE